MSDQPQPPAAPRTRQHIKWDQQFPQRKASHRVFPSEKVGRAGVANKSSQKVKAFLDEVFDDVFAREAFKQYRVEQIVNLTNRRH